MASERRTCKRKGPGCKGKFSRPLGSRRESCEVCSPPRKPKAEPVPEVPAVDPGPGPIEVAVAAELDRTGRAGTIEGVALLSLARDADRLPAERRAAVIEKLLRVKALALAGVRAAGPDPVDDIARKRAERMASA